MNTLVQRLARLSAAEEFLDFFGIPYEQQVLNVSRLHILKRFYQYMRQEQGLDTLDELEMFKRLRTLLARAYNDFVHSTPAREKVFKVFHGAGRQTVSLDSLRTAMRAAKA
ncbi:nitrogenase stabilizing/protective protein NifW [Herbaspirillum sp. HC18]|nr:nitrogenase stabilizing/protective protein NifW [Herbaspirillum sp. HC18]